MQKERVFKKRYAIGVFIIVLAWLIYMLTHWMIPVEQIIFKKVELNKAANIYIVQSNAGATTPFGYHYYLVDAKITDANFIKNIDDYPLFLSTKDDKATIKVINNQIYLQVSGTIYSFGSPAFYKVGSDIHIVEINLTATP